MVHDIKALAIQGPTSTTRVTMLKAEYSMDGFNWNSYFDARGSEVLIPPFIKK